MGNITNKLTSVVLSATTAVLISGFAMLVPIANAQAAPDLQSQINALLQQISALQAQLAAQTGAPAASCNFTRDLTVGAKGDDVKCLQGYLKVSPQSGFFGPLTKAAVAKWQAANGVSPAAGYWGPRSRAKYASLIAAAPAPTPSPTPSPAAAGSGLTVTLDPVQPASGLFGESFASRPFTKLNLSASADGDVTVKSLTIERQGQGNDAAFSGVIGLDADGLRMGDAKTFGSDHRLKLTSSFVVKAGQTKTITLAGDSDSDQNDYNGQLVTLALVAVDAGSAAVNASLPLVGNVMTVNSTLSIGSMTLARGPLDPGNSPTKEIGTTAYTYSSLQLTAGSAEDVLVKSISWNQSGSAAPSDLTNVKIYLDGVPYDVTASSDGKYYTAKFGDKGITILKGLNKEVYIKSDIAGGSNRTIDFDLYRYADLNVVGATYGYGILPSATEVAASADDGNFHSAQPNFDAFQVTIGAGTMQVQNATAVGAQNIPINLADQPLGGMIVDVKGEDITVAAMNFDTSAVKPSTGSRSLDTNDITNITLVDENGKVVAGPVDGVAGGNNGARFTDTVTFKVGRHTYTLKGKLNTDFANNDTIAASTTPSSDWTTVKGVTSATTITPNPTTAVTLSTMTVKSATLTVSLTPDTQVPTDASSTAQTVVAGVSGYGFTKYVLDASGSGEDVKVTSMSLRIRASSSNTADDMTNCQLWDGNAALNSGTNIVNPTNSDAAGDTKVYSFDLPLTVAKGTVKTLELRCNLISGANASGQYGWGITNAAASVVSTGSVSGQSITETITADNGRVISAVASGSLAFTLDPSSPALKWVQAGSTDNTLAILRFNATNEDVRIDTLGLQLGTSTAPSDGMASNSPIDLTKVTVWDGGTKVGEAVFSATDYATATLTNVIVPKNNQKLLTVKADAAAIYINGPGKPGHLLLVNYDASNSSNCSGGVGTSCQRGAVGVGMASGVAIGSAGTDSAANGARLSAAIPTVARVPLANTKFTNTSGQTLYRFKVSAPAGTNGLSLYKFTFNIATNTSSVVELPGAGGVDPTFSGDFAVTNFRVYCYSDANFSATSCGSWDNSGLLNAGGFASANNATGNTDPDDAVTSADPDQDVSIFFNPTDSAQGSTNEGIRIPAGESRYFVFKGDVTGGTSTPSITTRMMGDAQFASLNNAAGGSGDTVNNGSADGADSDLTTLGDNWNTGRYIFATTATNVNSWDDNDFIWSGNSTNTSQSVSDYDWFDGYLVPGLSNTDIGDPETLTLQ